MMSDTSGEFDLSLTKDGNQYFRRVYCDMESTICGPEKDWMMVGELDMSIAGSANYVTPSLCLVVTTTHFGF